MTGRVVGSLESLPDRWRPEFSEVIPARFRVQIAREGRDVVVDPSGCRVEEINGYKPDAEIHTDRATWLRMDAGELSGIEAFAQRKLSVRGSIDKSLHFEPMFERPAAGGLSYSMERVRAGRLDISTLVAGPTDAPPLLLVHGLGATKGSWLTVVPELARHFRVLAVDLPGYGASSKPLGRYTAPWFAKHMFTFLDAFGYDRTFVAGNSMGGRIAMEMAMMRPRRVSGIACLCPVSAFAHRPGLWLVKLLRPELGMAAARLPRERIKNEMRQLFCNPDGIEEDWYAAAIDDFLATWNSPRARMAFFSSLRNIYLDEPFGENGFWQRLEQMTTPALYFYGAKDVLISARFAHKVTQALPNARVLTWKDCGHVPQLEHPERTSAEMIEFFSALSK